MTIDELNEIKLILEYFYYSGVCFGVNAESISYEVIKNDFNRELENVVKVINDFKLNEP